MDIETSPQNTFPARSTLKTRMIWFLLVALAIAPLFPLSNFVGHPHWDQIRWIPFQKVSLSWSALIDVTGNTLWFMVFGYLLHYQLNWDSRAHWTIASITAIAGAVSLSAELFQVFCHGRFPSMTDVVCNVLGAGLGGHAAEQQPATTSIAPRLTRWLTLVFGQKRDKPPTGACRQDLPLE